MLDLNITLLFQLGNFFIAVFLLNVLLIKPIREVLKKRRAMVDSLTGEAESFESRAEQKLADYDAALKKARQDASQTRQAGRQDGIAEQQTILAGAQKEARAILDKARAKLQDEANATIAALRGEVDTLSKKIADRLIQN
jgi:F-type H+-transporting ATPase subunit b